MLYLDTSALVKLYVKEQYSRDLSLWLAKNKEALPITNLHELEFINAISLKRYRGDILKEDAQTISSSFKTHKEKGIFFFPSLDWVEVYKLAIKLSEGITPKTGARSLDIMHVASALSINATGFLTFDERQEKCASRSGLHIISGSSLA
ncbi:MAG: type II toxin-antitoxin system VapC family toxin [Thermodesulfobacteriota bacterium]|nr:type II toxin-antitoxin system VapC family toxin [Thermodesulfobacteriota bacterium]